MFSYAAQKMGLRNSILIALVFSIVGNIVYTFAMYNGTGAYDQDSKYSLGTYQMVIVGRIIAGIGSAALGLGVVYFTRTTSIGERTEAIGMYRFSQVRRPPPFLFEVHPFPNMLYSSCRLSRE